MLGLRHRPLAAEAVEVEVDHRRDVERDRLREDEAADDRQAQRLAQLGPGAQAAAQFQVRAPLKEAGLTKADIRALSAELGLPTADKPQMACLSSRVPYGEAVTPEKLNMIEQAENVLRDLGFHDVRVRHHELRKSDLLSTINSPLPAKLHLARIEVGPAEMRKFLENGISTKAAEALKQIGYAHVTLDLQGYRRGSTNEVLKSLSDSPVRKAT